jgi:hypothetical protein
VQRSGLPPPGRNRPDPFVPGTSLAVHRNRVDACGAARDARRAVAAESLASRKEGTIMKNSWMWKALLATTLAIAVRPTSASAQTTDLRPLDQAVLTESGPTGQSSQLQRSGWSGPRMGLMMAPGDGAIARRLRDHGLGSVVSQFGWQFERRIVPFGGGPQLVTEAIPLFGGVEYGKLVPSLTLVMGVRSPSGFEFGMGPSFTVVSATGINAGLVIAAGKSLNYGAVCIPLNLAVSTNPKGTMVTLIAGYAIDQAVN